MESTSSPSRAFCISTFWWGRIGKPCSPIADAVRYPVARWEGLTSFVDDGRIEIDSNTVERSIRPIALARKNALFAGSDGGAKHWAAIASLVETCKLNGINPEAYLADTITSIVREHPQSRLGELLPWTYTAHVA